MWSHWLINNVLWNAIKSPHEYILLEMIELIGTRNLRGKTGRGLRSFIDVYLLQLVVHSIIFTYLLVQISREHVHMYLIKYPEIFQVGTVGWTSTRTGDVLHWWKQDRLRRTAATLGPSPPRPAWPGMRTSWPPATYFTCMSRAEWDAPGAKVRTNSMAHFEILHKPVR